MATWYPVMLNMVGKRCLVCGGGQVAERKIRGLLEAGADVRVVSPAASSGLRSLAEQGRLTWQPREAEPEDIEGADFVFAAADDAAANRHLAAAAGKAGVPVNLADDGEAGDFLLPAVVRRGRFVLTASTSGASPALASRIARELADKYGPEYEIYADALREIRRIVLTRVPDAAERRKLLSAAADDDFLRNELSDKDGVAGNPEEWIEALRRRVHPSTDREEPM